MPDSNDAVLAKITELYEMLYHRDGYGEMTIEMRILPKGQEEVIIRCGKQFRSVIDLVSEKFIAPMASVYKRK